MPCTTTQTGPRSCSDEHEVYDRLNWLIAVNRYEAYRRSLFQSADDEWQAQFMRRPIMTERAFALFGTLLGALAPTALFFRYLPHFLPANRHDMNDLVFYCSLMNVICILVGGIMGAKVGRCIDEFERESWSRMILLAGFNGLCWGILTGAAGGAVVFDVGPILVALLALPVGVAAFVFFTILHRLVAHGGMIDARHFWPLACGVTTTIAVLILGL